MVDGEFTPDQVLGMPLRDAVQLMATVVWFELRKTDPTARFDAAFDVPLSAALAALQAAEDAG